jgi:hypothetical protein
MLARRQRGEHTIDVAAADPAAVALAELLGECLAADRECRPGSGREMARRLALVGQPRARGLLGLPRGGWRRFARARPFVAASACMTLPNLIMAIANNMHQRRIIDASYATADLAPRHADALRAFHVAGAIVNVIVIPLAIWIGWRVWAGIVPRLRGTAPPIDAAMSRWQIMREQAALLIKSGFLPQSIKTPEQAVAIMMMGEGFGMISQPAQTFSLGRSASAKVLAIIRRVPTIDSNCRMTWPQPWK